MAHRCLSLLDDPALAPASPTSARFRAGGGAQLPVRPCCRAIWNLFDDELCRQAVEVSAPLRGQRGVAELTDVRARAAEVALAARQQMGEVARRCPAADPAWKEASLRQEITTVAESTTSTRFDARITHIIAMSVELARGVLARESPASPETGQRSGRPGGACRPSSCVTFSAIPSALWRSIPPGSPHPCRTWLLPPTSSAACPASAGYGPSCGADRCAGGCRLHRAGNPCSSAWARAAHPQVAMSLTLSWAGSDAVTFKSRRHAPWCAVHFRPEVTDRHGSVPLLKSRHTENMPFSLLIAGAMKVTRNYLNCLVLSAIRHQGVTFFMRRSVSSGTRSVPTTLSHGTRMCLLLSG